MLRTVLAVALFVAPAPFAARSQDSKGEKPVKPIYMTPKDFKTGVVGYFCAGEKAVVNYRFDIIRVVDAKSMVLRLPGQPSVHFLARMPTTDLVDGGTVELSSYTTLWRVTGTAKVAGRTMFVVEPYK